MSRRSLSGELGFEAFGTACGLAVVTGALAAVAAGFTLLTGTLAALAVAGWASRHRRSRLDGGSPVRPRGSYVLPFAALGAGALVFLDPPGELARWRALLLALGLLPLWLAERRRPAAPRVSRP